MVCVTYRTVSVTSEISSKTARISLPLFAFSRRKIANVCDIGQTQIRVYKVSHSLETWVMVVYTNETLYASPLLLPTDGITQVFSITFN